MKIPTWLIYCLLIAALAISPAIQVFAENMEAVSRLDSIVITFDPPIVNRCNRAADLYNLLINTVKMPEYGIQEQIDKTGTMWSASHSLCGVQFSLMQFDDPAQAAQICRNLLNRLASEMPAALQKVKHSPDFADYIHALLQAPGSENTSLRKPVSVTLTRNLAAYADELNAAATRIESVYNYATGGNTARNVLPGVLPTVYTVFRWPEMSASSFFTAKYLGEKFIREAGLDSLIKYEIIYEHSAMSLVVYLSGSEEQLAENMQKFRQIEKYRLGREPPSDWLPFSLSLSEILADDQRDLAKKAMFLSWLQHWQGSLANIEVSLPAHPEHNRPVICMPEDFQHHLSFSNNLFPDFAASWLQDGGNICDITLAIGGDNKSIVREIHADLNSKPFSMMPLTLTLDSDLLKIVFSCSSEEVSGNLARLRNHIYSNLVEKGLISEPVDTLKIGIAGVSGLPPFELRGLMQKGWSPVADGRQITALTDYAGLLSLKNAAKESLYQRWQLYLASSRGRSELLAIIAAAGHQIKNFSLAQEQ